MLNNKVVGYKFDKWVNIWVGKKTLITSADEIFIIELCQNMTDLFFFDNDVNNLRIRLFPVKHRYYIYQKLHYYNGYMYLTKNSPL